MSNYCFENNTFIIKDYDKVAPFSSFLPGIAGAKGIPVYIMTGAGDEAEVDTTVKQEGIFYLSFVDGKVVTPIDDNDIVFGPDTSLVSPVYFKEHSISEMKEYNQVYANRIPSGFTPCEAVVKAGDKLVINTLIGLTNSGDEITQLSKKITAPGYLEEKESIAMTLVAKYTADVKTHTSNALFDQYVEQCYLDNFLRGGYPFIFPQKDGANKVVHLFSRKHGDPEYVIHNGEVKQTRLE